MSVPSAFLSVIAIWSTTPLAIKWSALGAGPGDVPGPVRGGIRVFPEAGGEPVLHVRHTALYRLGAA